MKGLKKRKSQIVIVATAAAAVIATAIAAAVLIARGGSGSAYQERLEMADRYIEELEYEQAVAELRAAIEIEPDNSEAYLILSDVYAAMNDHENALAVLQEGYEATGDTVFTERTAELHDQLEELQRQKEEQERLEQEQAEKDKRERAEKFYEEYADLWDEIWEKLSIVAADCYLTKAEREQAFRGLADRLEQYIGDLLSLEGLEEQFYGEFDGVTRENTDGPVYPAIRESYEDLAQLYLYLNDLEQCLRVRTEWAGYFDRPDLAQDDNHGYWLEENSTYDRYGRQTGWTDEYVTASMTYADSHMGVIYMRNEGGGIVQEETLSYDDEDRVIEREAVTDDGGKTVTHYEYTYTGSMSCIVNTTTETSGGMTYIDNYEVFYDQYGVETEMRPIDEQG